MYHLPKGRIGTTGLLKVDLNRYRYLSIITTTGIEVLKSMPIKSYGDLRFRVRKDFGLTPLSSEEAEKLKQFAMGGTVQSGMCSVCGGKAGYKTLDVQERCKDCHNKETEFWVCQDKPTFHLYCDHCHRAKNIEKELKNTLSGGMN